MCTKKKKKQDSGLFDHIFPGDLGVYTCKWCSSC